MFVDATLQFLRGILKVLMENLFEIFKPWEWKSVVWPFWSQKKFFWGEGEKKVAV